MAGSISALIPEFQPYARALVDAAGSAGLQPRVTSTLRSRAEQTRLYRRYLEGLSQFPAAPPGRSAHEFGFALDMVVSPMEYLPAVGAWWQSLGGVWHPSDVVHFEFPGFQVPVEETFIQETVRTWAEWFNDLPWYVQLALPLATVNQPADKPVTRSAVERILKAAGY